MRFYICIINEEIISLKKNDIIKNIFSLLDQRKKEINEEIIEIENIIGKMNVFKLYLNPDLLEIKNDFLDMKKKLNEDLDENWKIRVQINKIKDKKEQGLKSKYENLKEIEIINNQLINTYFSKNTVKIIKEEMNKKIKEIKKFIFSL